MTRTIESQKNPNSDSKLQDDDVDISTETSKVEFKLTVTPTDFSLGEIVNLIDEKVIIIPSYQRKYVWNIRRASALIESFIIGLPVPQLFFYQNSEGELEVIDGQQRITSVYYFFKGYFGGNGKRRPFKLSNLLQRKDLNGKTFEELDKSVERRLRNSFLRGVIIRQLTPVDETPQSVYHIYERLNMGGEQLAPQEIRNAIFRGEILDAFKKLNNLPSWRKIYGKSDIDPKQRDIELILRLFALFENSDNYQPPMKDFLSSEMSLNKSFASRRAKKFVKSFKLISDKVSKAIDRPFRPNGPLNAATMEAIMIALMETGEQSKIRPDVYEELLSDEEFLQAISSNTTSRENLITRHEVAKEYLSLP